MQLSGLERIALEVFPDETNEISIAVARRIADVIRDKNSRNEKIVLGLATGNTYLDVYRELARMYKEDGLDFSRVVTFNLDEYYGIDPNHANSFNKYMHENFFKHVNIKKKNIHIPDGRIPRRDLGEYCRQYENMIKKAGGIDIQLIGIGRDGHIGYAMPGAPRNSRTGIVNLDKVTRIDALGDFGERRYVPNQAITMGIGTILEAKQIILMARGDHKAPIIKNALEGRVTENVPASCLQTHGNTKIYLDRAAASQLTKMQKPWTADGFEWSDGSIVRAVTYVSEKRKTPIAQLTQRDFSLEGIVSHTPHEWKQRAFELIMGKVYDNGMLPRKKKILVFSPHPDDDIISMGGTLRKLAANNEVHVVYMTSGYTAVFDYKVRQFINNAEKFNTSFGYIRNKTAFRKRVLDFLDKKRYSRFGMPDIKEVLAVKKAIRQAEAIKTCEYVGVKGYSFLDMPFYQTGTARKLPVTNADVDIVRRIISGYNPDLILAAGDMTDPNGTHRQCLSSIDQALDSYSKKPEMWLYRGAWQEYHPSEADVLVPLSKEEIKLKKEGILIHKSQRNPPPQPGHGKGEFWERSMKRNYDTARRLRNYGLEDYAAVEAFKRRKAA